ncbi:MAG TPA: LuxR C-terminal-related transcriptional regulator [Jiangellaceae bacterium]
MSEGGLGMASISAREAEVLIAVGEHLTNAEIGAKLFISVRTVESHVSSLLRKLGAADRRDLADLAARLKRSGQTDSSASMVLPSPLTSFVGRVAEQAALAEAIGHHRQVTAVGPGGVGKTRLALAVAAQAADEFADGVWFVDLVPVTDPGMVGATVAAALGIGEQRGRSLDDAVATSLRDGETLLVLDNCEHVLDGVVPFAERLLRECSRLTILATSRARFMAPFEWVFTVPPLSLPEANGQSDAVALFLDRARAAGWAPAGEPDRRRVERVCRAMDGIALAIELAVARLPALGLDGLEAALEDQLRVLTGRRGTDDRHQSVRAVLDWSNALLDEADQTLLRRVGVFAAPFGAGDAVEVAGFPSLEPWQIVDGLARLTEQSLLIAADTAGGTRYRALETIRQYALAKLADAGEVDDTRSKHLQWCRAVAAKLGADDRMDRGTWRSRFEEIADDMRAALSWSSARPELRAEAHALAGDLAALAFTRGLAGEAQQRYEQAAELAPTPIARAAGLRLAYVAAAGRLDGDAALRLGLLAAEAALAHGDSAGAAYDFAQAALVMCRSSGSLSTPRSLEEADELIARARELTGDDAAARAAVLTAEAFRADLMESHESTAPIAEQAVQLARQAGDRLAESAALDALTAVRAGLGDVVGAAETAARRAEVLAPLRLDVATVAEFVDMLDLVTETSLCAGDLVTARRTAERIAGLGVLSEELHLVVARLLVVTAVAGRVTDAVALGELFRESWERSGRPRATNLGMAVSAAAMACGLAGDEAGRRDWLSMLDQLGVEPSRLAGYGATFDAIVLLHRDRPAEALQRLAAEPESLRRWVNGMWVQWYSALRAEAAVLCHRPRADELVGRAGEIAAGNPIASTIVDRAAALARGDLAGVRALAPAFDQAGCLYQAARTLVLAGGDDAASGAAALAALGAPLNEGLTPS